MRKTCIDSVGKIYGKRMSNIARNYMGEREKGG